MTKVIAIQGQKWYSKAIQFYTWSPFSHVAIQVGLNVWEATSPRVRRLTEAEFWKAYEGEAALVLTPQLSLSTIEETLLVTWLDKHVGDDYAENSLVRFLFRTKPPQGKEAWVCSRYVFEAFEYIKRPLLLRIPSYKVTPSHIVISPMLRVERSVGAVHKSVVLKSPHES